MGLAKRAFSDNPGLAAADPFMRMAAFFSKCALHHHRSASSESDLGGHDLV
jgi:hypothetical protein